MNHSEIVGSEPRKISRYPEYTGKRCWNVHHPEYGSVMCYAPSWQAAIVTAATIWRTKWTEIDFYSNCEVKETSEAGGKARGFF